MKLFNKYSFPVVLMSLSILVLLLFQLFWLRKEYQQQKEFLQQETSNVFISTVRELQDSLIRQSILGPMQLLQNRDSSQYDRLFVFNTNDSLANTLPAVGKERNIVFRNLSHFAPKDSNQVKFSSQGIRIQVSADSTEEFLPLKEDLVESVVLTVRAVNSSHSIIRSNGEADSTVIEIKPDSLRVRTIAENYSLALQHTEIELPFFVRRMEKGDSTTNWNGIVTSSVKGSFTYPGSYLAQFPNYQWYLLKKISPQILFSFFLISITTLSFWLIYRNLQQQRRLTALKNDFISNVTHELKTPITTVSVAIEALSNFNALQSPERTEEYLQISKNELSRLSLLVDKVLRMSIFEKQEPELKLETFDLKELVQEILNSMKLQFERFTAQVQFQWSENDYTLEGDRLHIMSVIYNLIDNALKYGGKEPGIGVNLQHFGSTLTITISDNGMGIPQEYQDKIFDKFFRIPTGDRHDIKGHGLGLSYVSSVIRQHKGQIQVESKPGQGSSFTVQLPKQQGTG